MKIRAFHVKLGLGRIDITVCMASISQQCPYLFSMLHQNHLFAKKTIKKQLFISLKRRGLLSENQKNPLIEQKNAEHYLQRDLNLQFTKNFDSSSQENFNLLFSKIMQSISSREEDALSVLETFFVLSNAEKRFKFRNELSFYDQLLKSKGGVFLNLKRLQIQESKGVNYFIKCHQYTQNCNCLNSLQATNHSNINCGEFVRKTQTPNGTVSSSLLKKTFWSSLQENLKNSAFDNKKSTAFSRFNGSIECSTCRTDYHKEIVRLATFTKLRVKVLDDFWLKALPEEDHDVDLYLEGNYTLEAGSILEGNFVLDFNQQMYVDEGLLKLDFNKFLIGLSFKKIEFQCENLFLEYLYKMFQVFSKFFKTKPVYDGIGNVKTALRRKKKKKTSQIQKLKESHFFKSIMDFVIAFKLVQEYSHLKDLDLSSRLFLMQLRTSKVKQMFCAFTIVKENLPKKEKFDGKIIPLYKNQRIMNQESFSHFGFNILDQKTHISKSIFQSPRNKDQTKDKTFLDFLKKYFTIWKTGDLDINGLLNMPRDIKSKKQDVDKNAEFYEYFDDMYSMFRMEQNYCEKKGLVVETCSFYQMKFFLNDILSDLSFLAGVTVIFPHDLLVNVKSKIKNSFDRFLIFFDLFQFEEKVINLILKSFKPPNKTLIEKCIFFVLAQSESNQTRVKSKENSKINKFLIQNCLLYSLYNKRKVRTKQSTEIQNQFSTDRSYSNP